MRTVLLFSLLLAGPGSRTADQSGPRILYSDHYDQALGQGLFVRRHLEVAPGASRLRVLVRDASSGAVGSVSVPVKGEHAKGRQ